MMLVCFVNHMQLVDPSFELWFALEKMDGQTCQKNLFGDNLSFKDQKIMNPIVLDSP